MVNEKVSVGFVVDTETLSVIDNAAASDKRNRANFFIYAALKYAKEVQTRATENA